MRAILDVLLIALNMYVWVIVIQAILSWMLHFGILNHHNRLVVTLWSITRQLTTPLLSRIKKYVPPLGSLDLSPLVLILAVILIERVILYYIYPIVP